jgi:hypothetical protein
MGAITITFQKKSEKAAYEAGKRATEQKFLNAARDHKPVLLPDGQLWWLHGEVHELRHIFESLEGGEDNEV